MANQRGETTSTGNVWNRCIDEVNQKFETCSWWHKASDCEFNDGTTAENKVGAIKGITTNTNVGTTGYALDISALKSIFSLNGTTLNITL